MSDRRPEGATALRGMAGGRPPEGATRYRDGVRAVLPLVVPAGVFAASFGILAESAGMGRIAPIVMSATTFAGSAQFAAASVLDEGGAVAAAVAAAVLLNARYVPLGISVAPVLRGGVARRLAESQLVVDESWALANRGGGRFDRHVLIGAGLTLYPVWVGGTALGSLAGEALGDPERLGLDAAFPALFIALLVPLLRDWLARVAALVAGAIALVLIPVAPAGVPIVAASLVALVGWWKR